MTTVRSNVVETGYEERGVDSKDLQSETDPLFENRLFQAVLKYGVEQWSNIGVALGFSESQIKDCTYDKPTRARKLQAIIKLKVDQCDIEKTEECLLTACKTIPMLIIGAVEKYRQTIIRTPGKCLVVAVCNQTCMTRCVPL
jgi:hypothetical protein